MGFENTFFGFNNHSGSIFGKILPTIWGEAIATWSIMAEKYNFPEALFRRLELLGFNRQQRKL